MTIQKKMLKFKQIIANGMPEYNSPPEGLKGSSEEALAAVESLEGAAEAAERELKEKLLRREAEALAESTKPGEA